MTDVTRILQAIDAGDARAASDLLPLVYDELRKLAAHRMSSESADHTLEPTALVHEAYIRLVGKSDPGWQNRGHFFAAAAEAMRRILVDHARVKQADKRGGGWQRTTFDNVAASSASPADVLLLDELLSELTRHDSQGGQLVQLRYFAGLTTEEAAAVMGISAATAYRHWAFARAWLHSAIEQSRGSRQESTGLSTT